MPDDTTPYGVTTDLDRIDLDVVHRWLSTDAYWALGRSRETVETAARNSLNVGVLDRAGALCAYARVVTDRATFGWLCDVYVDPAHRGRGVGGLLVRSALDALEPMGLGRVVLSTFDAHGVYAKVGFTPLPEPGRWMIRTPPAAD
ncbi:GNAT family N-acetyltransferase [Lapillicoccus jejuensis]|uniref:Acetyltransferase (GNAT) family protein n=1 Tax=Lapillicoccus jejuensis TaxID=402171 RepID=A0A542DZN1_9MICO|nr:GNAT family N-acetyltransferase [Lapillicoccus jejuensis]TQJ08414.1 acetyltransferase (GNAT) family protein [Lapillicoccus jejuensis]